MNCQTIQSELALLAGCDLDDPDRSQVLKSHLATCPACQKRFASLQTVLGVLQSDDAKTYHTAPRSLWPVLARRISEKPRPRSLSDYLKGSWPMFSAVAACGLLLVYAKPQSQTEPVDKGIYSTPTWSQDQRTAPPASKATKPLGPPVIPVEKR